MSMHRIRLFPGLLLLLLPAGALAQVTAIPSTAPTQASPNPGAAPLDRTAVNASAPANVTWTGALLSVHATGQGLPSILRQIAQLTGMKVTGGVPSEPVFSTYGPGPVQAVMAALFDGMNVNMLLVNDSATRPKELILTARTGGATPPAPTQEVTVDANQGNRNPADANLAQPRPGRHTSPDSFQGAPALPDGQQGPPGLAGGFAPAGSANDISTNNDAPVSATTDANGTPQSPNGVRTPEQIFEELRKRQQGVSQ